MSADPHDEGRRSPARPSSPASVPSRGGPGWRGWPGPVLGFIASGWSAIWITAFAFGDWQVALPLMFLTGPVMAATRGSRRRQRRSDPLAVRRSAPLVTPHDTGRRPADWANRYSTPAAAPAPAPAPPAAPNAERSLATTVLRAESAGSRLDQDAKALIRELDGLLRPLLAQVRARDADPRVRHDLEAIASEHLPTALDTYLAMPYAYAHEHRTPTGTTPADELRTQLTLLVEGCRQLGDAVHDADVDRQQQLSRFLEAKFRRSDLDL